MASNIRFMYDNLWDLSAATLTASSEESEFPASNTQHIWHTRHWRSTGIASTEWLKIDLGSAQGIDVLIIKYHNLRTGGSTTLKLQGNATDSWGSPSYDQSITVTSNTIIFFLPSTETYRWWRITILDTGNPDGYFRIGRPFLGSYFEPSRNYVQPHNKQRIDPSVKRYSTGGQVSICEREKYILIPYNFASIITSEVSDFITVWDTVGQSIPYFVCEIPDSDPYLTTYYILNSDSWPIEEIYTKGALQINAETMR